MAYWSFSQGCLSLFVPGGTTGQPTMTIIKSCCCVLHGDRQGHGTTAELLTYKYYQEYNFYCCCYSW